MADQYLRLNIHYPGWRRQTLLADGCGWGVFLSSMKEDQIYTQWSIGFNFATGACTKDKPAVESGFTYWR